MGQGWKFVNIDARTELIQRRYGDSAWIDTYHKAALVDLLVVHELPTIRWEDEEGFERAKGRCAATCGLVSANLPLEIVYAILACLKDVDIVSLALTSSYFFRLLLQDFQRAIVRDTPSWAGHRLILVGDYADGVPKGVVSAEELSEWEALSEDRQAALDLASGASRNPFYSAWTNPLVLTSELWPAMQQRATMTELALFDRMYRLLALRSPDAVTKPGVLRNLTTKEFVRDAVLAECPNELYEASCGLGDMLCQKTVWTEEGADKGAWAGHRFDIRDERFVPAEEGWMDVSFEVLKELHCPDGEEGEDKDVRRAWVGVGLEEAVYLTEADRSLRPLWDGLETVDCAVMEF